MSGQDMASALFVTRAAVWKAIKALQEAGYAIDAVTNKGYRLRQMPDIIDEAQLQASLMEAGLPLTVYHYHEVTSTNDTALELVKQQHRPVLVLADAQSKGRGRRGRAFYSPENTGLYMSLAFGTEKSVREFRHVTALAALATAQAVDDVAFDGADTTQIKWVNDIFLNGAKVAGILTECHETLEDNETYIVIGIGLNVYAPENGFPKDLKTIAGAVFSGGNRKDGDVRSQICQAILRYLYDFMEHGAADCLSAYRRKSFVIGSYVKINLFQGSYRYAFVDGINDDYELLVTYDDGRKGTLCTGEVSVVKY